jgi:hypothetical protein
MIEKLRDISILMAIILLLWLILDSRLAHSEELFSNQAICNAIYIIEGKDKARQQFGIETVECKTFEKCEQICLNTVRNNKVRFQNQNKEKDFYLFLAKKYCPPNWQVWVSNLKFYLEKN